jgi:streptogramin lyase
MISKLRARYVIVTAMAALTVGLFAGSPAAAAKPGPVVATYKVGPGFFVVQAGLDAVWVLNADEYHYSPLYRIDPASHAMKLIATLPFATGGMVVAFGSIWVSDYFGNAVWRVGANGKIQDEIGVGLQPQWMHAAFGSIWVSNHHGASLSRIDPANDNVQATVQVGAPGTFRSGPQAVTDDGTRLYVGSSNLQALQSVDPATDAVSTPASIDDAFCGPMAAVGGFVWSVDGCTGAAYQLATDGSVAQVLPYSGVPGDIATRDGELWFSEDRSVDPDTGQGSDAVLEQRDPLSGAVLRTVAVGGDSTGLTSGFGDFWVYDSHAGTIRRIHV